MLLPLLALVFPVPLGGAGPVDHVLMMLAHVAMIAGMVVLMVYRQSRRVVDEAGDAFVPATNCAVGGDGRWPRNHAEPECYTGGAELARTGGSDGATGPGALRPARLDARLRRGGGRWPDGAGDARRADPRHRPRARRRDHLFRHGTGVRRRPLGGGSGAGAGRVGCLGTGRRRDQGAPESGRPRGSAPGHPPLLRGEPAPTGARRGRSPPVAQPDPPQPGQRDGGHRRGGHPG